jgi:hypothetical protein
MSLVMLVVGSVCQVFPVIARVRWEWDMTCTSLPCRQFMQARKRGIEILWRPPCLAALGSALMQVARQYDISISQNQEYLAR